MIGGVEVFLRVREAKTKKNAILCTPNVTVVPARRGVATKIGVILMYEKVIHLSITEYILTAVGGPKGLSILMFTSACRAAFILLMGFGFGLQRLSSGSGLLCNYWTLGLRTIEAFSGMHTAVCPNVLAFRCTVLCSCLQVGSCFGVGRNVEIWGFLANGYHCAINYWSDSST
jgi:hypothetical protein